MLCECDLLDCQAIISVDDVEEAKRYLQSNVYVISNECLLGPKVTDELIEEHETYKVYRKV